MEFWLMLKKNLGYYELCKDLLLKLKWLTSLQYKSNCSRRNVRSYYLQYGFQQILGGLMMMNAQKLNENNWLCRTLWPAP